MPISMLLLIATLDREHLLFGGDSEGANTTHLFLHPMEYVIGQPEADVGQLAFQGWQAVRTQAGSTP